MKQFIIILLGAIVLCSCNNKKPKFYKETGHTMGTTFSITSECKVERDKLDSILVDFSQMFSTYIEDSYISKLNKCTDTTTYFELGPRYMHFRPMFSRLNELHTLSLGAFNPFAGVLYDAWGFSEKGEIIIDDLSIKELIANSKAENFETKGNKVRKINPKAKFNLNAVAKGYGLDVVAIYLDSKGCKNYLIEIGGELVAKGTNPEGKPWRVGVRKPQKSDGSQSAIAEVNLNNRAMATSGNYENYKTYKDSIIGHTIDPRTGFPAKSRVLSSTVFATDCLTADALATACMVLGEEESIKLIENQENTDCFLIILDNNGEIKTYSSLGIKNDLELVK